MSDPHPVDVSARASGAAFPSALAHPPVIRSVIPAPADTPSTISAGVRRHRSWGWLVVLIPILVLLGNGVVSYFLDALGPGATIIGALLALLPLVAVLLAVRLIDRWEPEPLWLALLALAWGAVVAVAAALGVDMARILVFGVDTAGDTLRAIVQAPLVEEVAKGLGILVILVAWRRYFDGPVDGIVYGALIGAGFAFTENIQYFAISILTGGIDDTTVTFFFRGILSPFAHVMFTAVTGFAVGLAARRGAGFGRAFGAWLAGLVGAIVLHAIWNASATLSGFFELYVALQVPLFAGFVVSVILLRREEARLTRERLGEYAAAGWFTPAEVELVATGAGRRRAIAWARTLPGDRAPEMRSFIRATTDLAAARQRTITGRDRSAAASERAQLERAVATRSALLAGSTASV